MSVVTSKLPRQFKYQAGGKDVILEDPNPNMDLESVKNLYSTQHPELVNAKVNKSAKISDDGKYLVYEFGTKVGTKG